MRLLTTFSILFPMLALAQPAEIAEERELIEVLLTNEQALDSLTDNALANSYWLKSFEGELAQQYENVAQEKNKWFSTFRLGVNFFSINTSYSSEGSITTAGLLPNIGFSLFIDPEKFINRGSYIREAKYNIVRAENQLQHQRKQIRTELIQLFYTYLESLGISELRAASVEAQSEQCQLMNEKFKRGEVDMDAVLLNQNALLLAQESLMRAQLSQRKLKTEITLFTQPTEKHNPALKVELEK